MTPGKPFSAAEREFIRSHRHIMSRGQIAQELSKRFADWNGGYRSWRSVRAFIYREEGRADTTIMIRIPGSVYSKARQAGLDEEDIRRIAREAILDGIE